MSRRWLRWDLESAVRKVGAFMPDLPTNNDDLNPEELIRAQQEPVHAKPAAEPGKKPVRESSENQEDLREKLFGSIRPDPNSNSQESEPEERPSFWAKLLASATRGSTQKKPVKRETLRQNKTSMFLGVASLLVAMIVWLMYLVSGPIRQPQRVRTPSPGVVSTQAAPPPRSITPGVEAQPQPAPAGPDNGVTPADIRATAQDHPIRTAASTPPAKDTTDTDRYALGRIPPPVTPPPAPPPAPAAAQKNPLDQPSLVFVLNEKASQASASGNSNSSSVQPISWTPTLLERSHTFADLPTGTRLVARLETPASTAVRLPVVAAIEYNYENRNHELIIPAGSRAFGRLEQADSQGFVGLHFTSLLLPDQLNSVPFEARAIGLNYQPLKGVVTGRNTGRRFLVRALSGIGSVAAATVGVSNGTGVTDSFSNNVLLREQLMTNVGSAGDQELQMLAYQQHIVVTVPGNTRFYLVMDHSNPPASKEANPNDPSARRVNVAGSTAAPSSGLNPEEIRELVELRRELNQINQQAQTNQGATSGLGSETPAAPQTGAASSSSAPDNP